MPPCPRGRGEHGELLGGDGRARDAGECRPAVALCHGACAHGSEQSERVGASDDPTIDQRVRCLAGRG